MKYNKKHIVGHVLFWLAYLTFLMTQFSRWEYFEDALWRTLVTMFPQVLLAYLNIGYLIPKFLIKKKYLAYFGSLIVSFIALHFYYSYIPELFNIIDPIPNIHRFRDRPKPPGFSGWFRFNPGRIRATLSIMQGLVIVLASTAYKMVQIAIRREQEASLLKSENLHSELKFLKAQINPHFLFNALNNIYTLSMIKSAETPDMILKLSDMLRYILYDCNEDKVMLGKEISYINNYITLQKLKDDKINNIEFCYENVDNTIMIAPMILIPFVENAFKHGRIEDLENGWIRIAMETKDRTLHFTIENSLPDREYTKDEIGGIGLENVCRRLGLIYPDRHELKISQKEKAFSVTLNILV